MPVFKVLRRVDAYVDHVAEIEATDEQQAVAMASNDEARHHWKSDGVWQFDDRLFLSLDDTGRPQDEPRVDKR